MIMSTLILASASGMNMAAATPGLSATLAQRDLRLVARKGDAGDDLLFHDILLVANQRAGLRIVRIVEGRAHECTDLVRHRELDRAHLQHLGAERGHFQHFLEGDAVEPARLRHDARIGRIDAVDIGIDVAAVGLDRGGDGDGAGIRAAAAERRDAPACLVQALKAGDRPRPRRAANPSISSRAVDVDDARRAVRVVGEDRHLPALPRARRNAHVLQHDGQQPGGHLFARGDDGVIFARDRRASRRRWHQPTSSLVLPDMAETTTATSMAGLDLALDVARRIADALDIGDRRAAELHDQTGHRDEKRSFGRACDADSIGESPAICVDGTREAYLGAGPPARAKRGSPPGRA